MEKTVAFCTKFIEEIDLTNMRARYRAFSTAHDDAVQAKIYDEVIEELLGAHDTAAAWINKTGDFLGEYRPSDSVLALMRMAEQVDNLSARFDEVCTAAASALDKLFQDLNKLSRSHSWVEAADAILVSRKAAHASVKAKCRIFTDSAAVALTGRIRTESAAIKAEDEIKALADKCKPKSNPISWCSLVEGLERKHGESTLKDCRNYSLYLELKADAAFSRKVIRCEEYIQALGASWSYEKVFELNGTLPTFHKDLLVIIPDFDKKWEARLKEAYKAQDNKAEEWYRKGYAARDTKEGFALLCKAAELDHPKACCEIGYSYHFGRAVATDNVKAVKWIEKGMELGFVHGYFCFLLGYMYYNKIGVAQVNYDKAYALFKKGEGLEGGKFCYKPLAKCYLYGHGVTADHKKAYEYMLKYFSIETVEASAAEMYFEAGKLKESSSTVGIDLNEALKWHEKAAKLGHKDAKSAATRLSDKLNTEKELLSLLTEAEKSSYSLDFEKVYEYDPKMQTLAASIGGRIPNLSARWKSCKAFADKVAVKRAEEWFNTAYSDKDAKRRFALMEKSAKYGNLKAHGELGYYYYFGIGTAEDKKRSAHHIETALGGGLKDGYFNYLLGYMYHHGIGVTKDNVRSFELYRDGYATAYRGYHCDIHLGYCYYYGKGTETNYSLAYDCLLAYVKRIDSNTNAKNEYDMLGYIKQKGAGVAHDEDEALKWYDKAIEQGYEGLKSVVEAIRNRRALIDEIHELIRSAERKSESFNGEKALVKSWELGFEELGELRKSITNFDQRWQSCLEYAKPFAKRRGDELCEEANGISDAKKRFALMQRAASLGSAEAHGEIGYYYAFGVGTEVNHEKSVLHMEAALNGGLKDGYFYYLLGYKCEHGQGTPQNAVRAFQLYSKGVTMSYRRSFCVVPLAKCYIEPKGTDYAPEKAYSLLLDHVKRTGEDKSANECYWLGYLKHYCAAVGMDEREALKWYEKADKYGNKDAAKEVNYLRNKFAKIELDKRIDACYEAAMRGDVEAMDRVGEYYFTGTGVTKSYQDAIEWFEKAAKKGNRHAIERLGDCYMNGYGVKQNFAKAEKLYNQAAKGK